MRIAVIGAGLIGVTTAYFLRQAGHEVIVLDRRDGPGLETSFANGGMLTPSQAAPWNTPGIAVKVLKWIGREQSPILLKPGKLPSITGWGLSFLRHSTPRAFRANQRKNAALADYSLRVLEQLRRSQDISFDGTRKGTLKIYRHAREFDDACSMIGTFSNEYSRYEVADTDEILRLEPALSDVIDTVAGGIYFPDDQAGDAYKFCDELARLSAEAGVDFRYGTRVDRLATSADRICPLETSKGRMKADIYILAAGSYSPILAKSAGISLPVNPVKGYSITLAVNQTTPALPVIDESRHIAVTPLGDRIRVAGIAELAGYDASVDDKRINMMYRFFRELYPGLGYGLNLAGAGKWAGLRPYSSDGVPILGRCRLENLYLNTGHGHLGWSMAAGSANLLSDFISKGKAELDLTPYQLNRFS